MSLLKEAQKALEAGNQKEARLLMEDIVEKYPEAKIAEEYCERKSKSAGDDFVLIAVVTSLLNQNSTVDTSSDSSSGDDNITTTSTNSDF